MGYYTDYDFSCNPVDVIQEINKISGYGDDENDCRGEYWGVKWYNWATHMKQVSLLFPDILIKLSGVGEENGDQWIAYFKNGQHSVIKAEVLFPEFDEGDLK
jgi:hypothetical protein